MPLPGGPADKMGNNYEAEWTAHCMIEILRGEATSIYLEPIGDEGKGIEFILKKGDKTEYHQVKRQTVSGKWTVRQLEEVFRNFASKLDLKDSECVFVSTQAVPDLVEVKADIAASQSFKRFEEKFLQRSVTQRAFDQFCNIWQDCNRSTVYNWLNRVTPRTIDERSLHDQNRQSLKILLRDGDPDSAIAVLGKLTATSVHQELGKSEIQQHLEAQNIRLRSNVDRAEFRTVLDEIPERPKPFISRPNLVSNLLEQFSSENRMMVVEGPDGVGKTTLLVEFVRTHPDQCFWFAFEDDVTSSLQIFLYQLSRQISTALGKLERIPTNADESVLKNLFGNLCKDLQRDFRKSKNHYYIILDGFENIISQPIAGEILRIVRLNQDGIRVIVTCRKGDPLKTEKALSFRPPNFSPPEAQEFLRQIGVDSEDVRNQVINLIETMPVYLDAIRRRLERGDQVPDLITNLPDTFGELLGKAWEFPPRTEDMCLFLSILLNSPQRCTGEDISRILSVPLEKIEEWLTIETFVEHKGDHIAFISSAHRAFLTAKLEHHKNDALAALITNTQDKTLLPGLYSQKGDYEGLKKLLDVPNLIDFIQRTKSLSTLQSHLSTLVNMAQSNKDWVGLFKYSLMSSILVEYSTRSARVEEIEALISLGDYQEAYDRAFSAPLPEDRLQLLAALAKSLNDRTLLAPTLEEIRSIVTQVTDSPDFIHRALEIAADIFHVDAQTALDLMEHVARQGNGVGIRSMDGLLASLAARLKGDENSGSEALVSRITDSKLREMLRATPSTMEHLSAGDVLEEVEQIADITAKLFYLRAWCNKHKRSPEASRVIQKALDILLNHGDERFEFTLPMVYLRQLSEALPGVSDDDLPLLVERFDTLKDSSIRNPAQEYIRLEFALVRAERRFAQENSSRRLRRIYQEIDDIGDLDVRCYCYAKALQNLRNLDPNLQLRTESDLRQEIKSTYDALLLGSAEHYEATKNTLGTISHFDPSFALELADKLNTLERREKAFLLVVKASASELDYADSIKVLNEARIKLQDPSHRDQVVVIYLESIHEVKEKSPLPESILRLLEADTREISDPIYKSLALAYLICSANQLEASSLIEMSYTELCGSYRIIDADWDRHSLGYFLVKKIAAANPPIARRFLQEIENSPSAPNMHDNSVAEIYINTLRLATRMTSDLSKSPDTTKMIEDFIVQYVDPIPSSEIKIRLFSEIALRVKNGQKETFNDLIQRLSLILSRLKETSITSYGFGVTTASSSLLEYDPVVCENYCEPLTEELRESAYRNIGLWLISGRPPTADPIDWDSGRWEITLKSVDAIKARMHKMSSDFRIYPLLTCLIDALLMPPNLRNPHTETFRLGNDVRPNDKQGLEILKSLSRLVQEHLPDQRNIQHDGYKIASWGALHRLRSALGHRTERALIPGLASKEEIVEMASRIPNKADRITVHRWLSKLWRFCDLEMSKQLLEKAEVWVPELSTAFERAEAFSELLQDWKRIDGEEAKKRLDRAFAMTHNIQSEAERDEIIGAVLEVAHAVDPNFAVAVISQIDHPIRRIQLEDTIARIDLQKEPATVKDEIRGEDLAQVAWHFVERLCSNSLSTPILPDETAGQYLKLASQESFENAFAVFTWIIQNSLEATSDKNRTSDKRRVAPYLMDHFSAVQDAIKLTIEVAAVSEGQQRNRTIATPENLRFQQFETVQEARQRILSSLGSLNTQLSDLTIIDPDFTYEAVPLLAKLPCDRVRIFTSWRAQAIEPGDKQAARKAFEGEWNWSVFKIDLAGGIARDTPFKGRYYLGDSIGFEILPTNNDGSMVRKLADEEIEMALSEAKAIMEKRDDPEMRYFSTDI